MLALGIITTPRSIRRSIMNQSAAEELREFHRFVSQKLDQGNGALLPEDVLDEWREIHPEYCSSQESAETVTAVRQALVDMEAGDRGTPASEVLAELRDRLSRPVE